MRACRFAESRSYAKDSPPPLVRFVSKMAKKYEAVSDIRGKITAYKYVLSESLRRAAERSSFGNSPRSFATVVVLRVHCAQSFRPMCVRTCTHIYADLFIDRQRERERETERGRIRKRKRPSCLCRSILSVTVTGFTRETASARAQLLMPVQLSLYHSIASIYIVVSKVVQWLIRLGCLDEITAAHVG